VAVLANRVRSGKPVYAPLEKFVASLNISFLTRVSDSDVYVEAAESGVGVFELPLSTAETEQREFLPVAHWAQGDASVEAPATSNVICLSAARAQPAPHGVGAPVPRVCSRRGGVALEGGAP
jgi:hypothetical protein